MKWEGLDLLARIIEHVTYLKCDNPCQASGVDRGSDCGECRTCLLVQDAYDLKERLT